MQSQARAFKRGVVWGARHKTTKNRKGQKYYMQLITLHEIASDANQKCHKTIMHDNYAIKARAF